MLVDPDGRSIDWVESADGEIYWDENATSQATTKKDEKYLGEAVVIFNGSEDEKLGNDGTLTGEGAKPAKVTIYGKNGKDDIKTYNGLTMTSNPDEYVPIEEGDYKAFYQDMNSSPYGEKGAKKKGYSTALTYRISTLDGNLELPTIDGKSNPANHDKPIKTEIYLHRNNWSGKGTSSSSGCLNIDGRQWRNVEKQLGKSNNIFIRVTR
jgi:hypothetical protein